MVLTYLSNGGCACLVSQDIFVVRGKLLMKSKWNYLWHELVIVVKLFLLLHLRGKDGKAIKFGHACMLCPHELQCVWYKTGITQTIIHYIVFIYFRQKYMLGKLRVLFVQTRNESGSYLCHMLYICFLLLCFSAHPDFLGSYCREDRVHFLPWEKCRGNQWRPATMFGLVGSSDILSRSTDFVEANIRVGVLTSAQFPAIRHPHWHVLSET